MGRLPTKADFPARVKLDIVAPPGSDQPTNILLLLHGLGDTHASFTRLAQQLKLPETVCISLNGPASLLDLGGAHWGDDIIFDSTNGGLDPDSGFTTATKVLRTVVETVLIEQCGYKLRDILFFGFGQGGMAALNFAASLPTSTPLAGIISIAAPLPSSTPASLSPKVRTPVLVCAGSSDSSVTTSSEEKLKHVFEDVQIKRYRRPGDSMPSNRDEMLPVMQFFSRTLRSVEGVPEGSVEIGS